MGEVGPDENLYTQAIGATSGRKSRNEPLDMSERILRAKMRDGFRCARCGATEELVVHHTKGTKSHRPKDLITLCQECHHKEHGYREKDQTQWRAGCDENRTSGSGRGIGETA